MLGIGKTTGLILGGLLLAGGASFVAYNHGVTTTEDRVYLDWEKSDNEKLLAEIRYKDKLNKIIMDLREDNTKLSESVRIKYVDRVNTITETEYKNRDVIKEVFVGSPYMPKGWVYAHDQLTKNQPIDPELAANAELSEYTWEDGLQVIAVNYSIAEKARGKDEAWNTFYSGVSSNFANSVRDNSNETGDRAVTGPTE